MKPVTNVVQLLAGLSLFSCGACSGSHAPEQLGHQSQAVSVTSGPVPFNPSTNSAAWDGSAVELMVADAWASCSFGADGKIIEKSTIMIRLQQALQDHMGTAQCTVAPYNDSSAYPAHSLQRWFDQRNDERCNYYPDATGTSTRLGTANLQKVKVQEQLTNPDGSPIALSAANDALREAGVDYCIAQTLRNTAPGTAGAEALTLGAYEQIELLSYIRFFSQEAMLNYTWLGTVFAAERKATSGDAYDLQHWADTHPDTLLAMGRDFAADVQLHYTATRELAGLYGRSASARLPRGGSAKTDADEIWGAGSWRQRLMALLYGGDPLAGEPDGSQPWRNPLGSVAPGGFSNVGWPDSHMLAYTGVNTSDPKVEETLRLARQYDAVQLDSNDYPGFDDTLAFSSATSGLWMYRAIEAGIRSELCVKKSDGTCTWQPWDVATPGANLADYEVYKRYSIQPSHTRLLTEQLADSFIGPVKNSDREAVWRAGMFNVDGVITTFADAWGSHWKISPGFALHDKPIEQTAPYYAAASFSGIRFPTTIDATKDLYSQSLFDIAQERLGAASAIAAARIALNEAHNLHDWSSTKNFFAQFDTIDAIWKNAVGSTVVSWSSILGTPDADTACASDPSGCWNKQNIEFVLSSELADFSSGATSPRLFAVKNDTRAASLARYPHSKTADGSTIDAILAGTTGATVVEAKFVSRDELSAGGEHLQRLRYQVNLPFPAPAVTGAPSVADIDKEREQEYTLIAVREPSAGSGGSRVYALLAGGMHSAFINFGTHVAPGGALGAYAQTVTAKDTLNPSEPAFDGFGLPMRWVPPSDPILLGGSPGQDPIDLYLARAKSAAADASTAVGTAFDTLLADEASDNAKRIAAARSSQVAKMETQQLCGDAADRCDTSLTWYNFDHRAEWNAAVAARPDAGLGSFDSTYAKCVVPVDSTDPLQTYSSSRIDCVVLNMFGAIKRRYRLSSEVVRQADADAVPSFVEYEGGTLQGLFINEWTALRGVRDQFREVLDAAAAVRARALAFEAKIGTDTAKWNAVKNSRCSEKELVRVVYDPQCHSSAVRAGDEFVSNAIHDEPIIGPVDTPGSWVADNLFGGGPDGRAAACEVTRTEVQDEAAGDGTTWDDYRGSPSTSYGVSAGGGVGFMGIGLNSGESGSVSTPGDIPVGVRRDFCRDTKDTLKSDTYEAMSAFVESYATLAQKARFYFAAGSALAHSAADAAAAARQTEIAITNARLEAELAVAGDMTSFKLYRRVHSYDAWRAHALLEAARIAAVVARRAIESRFVVNLSKMRSSEPLVAAPATWADEVYAYDLNLPAAVGLTAAPTGTNGLYPQKLTDYVGNLDRFVQGFAIARPTAAAHSDTNVIELPGPLGVGLSAAGAPVPGSAFEWQYECGDGTWRSLPSSGKPSDACLPGLQPKRARISFDLDGWGQVNGVNNAPYSKRYNARWSRLAVNIVGTGVLDCMKAADPKACYASTFIPYDVRHVGPAWLTDSSQTWTTLAVPTGRIEAGKALAAEQWLDPVSMTWSKPYVDAIARTEFENRPFGGMYELEFELGPEVLLENIERIQILAGSNYWVSQL